MPACIAARPTLLLCALSLALAAAVATPAPAHAQDDTPEEVGLKIAENARAREEGFGNFTAQQVMLLRNKQGQESRRQLRVQVLEVSDDGDRSLFVFDEPRDVQGTAFLVHAHRDDSNDQWLYLPALRRVKRISSANRSGSFMGSEFAYEDLTPQEVEKFTYRYLRDEPCGNQTCTVTERTPRGRQVGLHAPGGLARSGRAPRLEGGILRPQGRPSEDPRHGQLRPASGSLLAGRRDGNGQPSDGKSTVLTWTDYQFQTDLDDGDFTQTGLRRAR